MKCEGFYGFEKERRNGLKEEIEVVSIRGDIDYALAGHWPMCKLSDRWRLLEMEVVL